MKEAREDKEPKFTGWSNVRYVWQRPPNPQARTVQSTQPTLPEDLNLTKVQQHCAALEPYFRATHWHSGRVAVALGSFLAYVLGTDVAQGYLSLTTVFEALLSPGGTEITHQISERASYLLEHDEEGRYAIYKRMKQLYKTRSQLVHGAVENKKGLIKTDRLRLDARFTIVPDQEYFDLFELCIRLVTTVLDNPELLALLEQKESAGLNEWYLRLGFRGAQ